MRVFKTPSFSEWAANERLSDEKLAQAVREMEEGLSGDALGSGIFKKRVGLRGKGRSGGARTIVAFRQAEVAVFMFGFSRVSEQTFQRANSLHGVRMQNKSSGTRNPDGTTRSGRAR